MTVVIWERVLKAVQDTVGLAETVELRLDDLDRLRDVLLDPEILGLPETEVVCGDLDPLKEFEEVPEIFMEAVELFVLTQVLVAVMVCPPLDWGELDGIPLTLFTED